jgi:hypothetical protein
VQRKQIKSLRTYEQKYFAPILLLIDDRCRTGFLDKYGRSSIVLGHLTLFYYKKNVSRVRKKTVNIFRTSKVEKAKNSFRLSDGVSRLKPKSKKNLSKHQINQSKQEIYQKKYV